MNRDPGIRYAVDANRFAVAFEERVRRVNRQRHACLMESSHWAELAADAGCSTDELAGYVDGEPMPEVRLVLLAAALDVPPASLVQRRNALMEIPEVST